MAHVPDAQDGGEDLPHHGGDCRAHHAPVEAEDKNRVKDHVHHSAEGCGHHGKPGVSVRPDDGIHALAEDIERDADGDPEKVLSAIRKGLCIDPPAEQGEQHVFQQQVNHRDSNADGDAEDNRIPHGALRVFGPPRTETQRDIGARAVTDHDRKGKRNDRHRVDDGIRGISVASQIRCVGDKELIDDVIQRRDQQGNDAGDGVSAHQNADALRLQKAVGLLFHGKHTSTKQNEKEQHPC